MIVRSVLRRTNQVIANARVYLNISPWTPLQDRHVFNPANPAHTFHSAFRIVAGRQYDVVPYVYGGNDSVTIFQNRVASRTCPGGWSWDGQSANTTYHWYARPTQQNPQWLGYEARVPRYLAGIDCSSYVSRCWKIPRHTTRTLPNICLEIERSNLRAGDILNRPGHVRIFNSWVGRRIDVYEATGGSARREFRPGDEFGRVVHHTIAWDDHYTPFSPFPQFEVIEPATCPVFGPRPTFKIRVRGSGTLALCEFSFDRNSIVPQIRNTLVIEVTRNWAGCVDIMDLTYTPNYDLMPGKYSLLIEATNRVARQSFKDELSWDFQAV
jgi:hypothetical protein